MAAIPPQAILDASALMRARRFAEARARLESYLNLSQPSVQALWLLGGACQELGDLDAARNAFSRILQIDPRWVPARVALGELLARADRGEDAERELRRALADDPHFARARVGLAQLLRQAERPRDALAVTAPAAEGGGDAPLLLEHALALRAWNRDAEALEIFRQVATQHPDNAQAAHYLAVALHDTGRNQESAVSARRALDLGLDGAETWGALARALAATHRLDEAEQAYRTGLQRDPDALALLEDYSRLVWLRTGDLALATKTIDAAIQRHPNEPRLLALKAQLHGGAGDHLGTYQLFARAATIPGAEPSYEASASAAALKCLPERVLEHARRAAARAPEESRVTLIQALLVSGGFDEADVLLQEAEQAQPESQHLVALRAILWRSRQDPRYQALYDYAHTVRAWTLDTPPGWPDLDSFLVDLRTTLRRLHNLHGHPPDQSLRGGSQTMGDLASHPDPTIRAFFDHAITGPIARHIDWLGRGSDVLRRRNTGKSRIHSAWSVQLRPEGFHVDHVHPDGWLSSACYIDLPDSLGDDAAIGTSVDESRREGWIRFGAAPLPMQPSLPAEHYVRPSPGTLVLFPSYMWHGTVPFHGPQTRLTIAFDIVPG